MPMTAKVILFILWFINLSTSEKGKSCKTTAVCANNSAKLFPSKKKRKKSQPFLGCNQWVWKIPNSILKPRTQFKPIHLKYIEILMHFVWQGSE